MFIYVCIRQKQQLQGRKTCVLILWRSMVNAIWLEQFDDGHE